MQSHSAGNYRIIDLQTTKMRGAMNFGVLLYYLSLNWEFKKQTYDRLDLFPHTELTGAERGFLEEASRWLPPLSDTLLRWPVNNTRTQRILLKGHPVRSYQVTEIRHADVTWRRVTSKWRQIDVKMTSNWCHCDVIWRHVTSTWRISVTRVRELYRENPLGWSKSER